MGLIGQVKYLGLKKTLCGNITDFTAVNVLKKNYFLSKYKRTGVFSCLLSYIVKRKLNMDFDTAGISCVLEVLWFTLPKICLDYCI